MIHRVGPATRGLIAAGRTCPRLAPRVSEETLNALVEEHGVPGDAESVWAKLSVTQRLDLIATQMLANDRAKRIAEYRAGEGQRREGEIKYRWDRRRWAAIAAIRGDYLSSDQHYRRRSREVLFKDLDFLDRTFHWTQWHWDDGGWYGDAPTIIAEVLPALYDGMRRSPRDFWVGVWWSPPLGTRGAA